MSFYATNETIEEMKLQMKGMPTLSGMDLRFKTMTDEMNAFQNKIKTTYVKDTKLQSEIDNMVNLIEKGYLSKIDFKKSFAAMEANVKELTTSNKDCVKNVKKN